MKKFLIFIIAVVLIIILVFVWLFWKGYRNSRKGGELSISTYQAEYSSSDNPKIKIENKSGEPICFSSCYPYYLEKKDGTLQSYQYGDCPRTDVIENCINPEQVKAFELMLDQMEIEKGFHRVAVPACVGCAFQSNFRQDKFFYSNEFIIK